ncbi:MAG: HEAT repeat domain-containing protein [Balneolaceae bacterium]|nr:MAG: HEAT repeat domain-containing protein [Balneolaceae bacterium]
MTPNEKHIDLITGYLQDSLSDAQQQEFDRLVRAGKIDMAEVREMEVHFRQLGDLPSPEPDPAMGERFHAMLQQEKEIRRREEEMQQEEMQQEEKNLSQPDQKRQERETAGRTPLLRFIPGLFPSGGTPRIRHMQTAASIAAVFLAGLLLGLLYPGRGTHDQQIQQIAAEVHDLREMMMISLLDESSAAERLRAVNISMEIPSPQEHVIFALVQTLHFDPNVNVRVAAVDALVHHGSHPMVREELVRAITRQPSPMVQIALADAMIALQEPRAAREFQKLLEQEEMEDPVRDKIEQTLLVLL